MSDAILIFTFSPIQPFITEARRAADLYVGSHILVDLAEAAADAISSSGGDLIYPTTPDQLEADALNKPVARREDAPNKLVARVPFLSARTIAENAQTALLERWNQIAKTAREELAGKETWPDDIWRKIWERQTAHLWEIYWAAARVPESGQEAYKHAYNEASRALDASKRSRAFAASDEPGRKDTLSGRREALHTAGQDAASYWKAVSAQPHVTAAKLRPGGVERLDAIGAVKRFCSLAQRPFPSTSTVASWDFLQQARPHLKLYGLAVQVLVGSKLFRVREDADWPYDGDLLYLEGLTPARLKDSYGLEVAESDPDLKAAQRLLRETYDQAGCRPALYYGIIMLDGDNMGQHVSHCLDRPDPAEAHRALSRTLADFAAQVRPLVKASTDGLDALVYNGGDDVLALAPLVSALTTGQKLAGTFQSIVADGTASAGIAIVHHTYPLGAALRAAREAEKQAKLVPGKAAVCVRVLKRSGDTAEMRSSWAALDEIGAKLVRYFIGDEQGEFLSSKFAYDVAQAAYALPEADDKWEAEVKRLILRHRNPKRLARQEAEKWARELAGELCTWAMALPEGPADLGRWLIFARFLAQRGGE